MIFWETVHGGRAAGKRREIEGDATGVASKPSRLEKITKALTAIEVDGTVVDCIKSRRPDAFLWEFYKAWVENGGQDGGKNRNSIRRMRDVWLTGNREVKSLHPKLTGSVRVSKRRRRVPHIPVSGALAFRRRQGKATGNATARRLCEPFSCERLPSKLCERLVGRPLPRRQQAGSAWGLRLAGPLQRERSDRSAASDDWDEIAKLHRNLDAYITLSRHNSAIGPSAVG